MGTSRPISTAEIPPQFLESTLMVGTIPFTALQTDPRISYTLYIPAEHYNPDPSRQHSHNSSDLDARYMLHALPLIVNVHGTHRDAEKCRDRLVEFADFERVAVLAPLYPAAIDSYTDLDNYKLLRYKSLRSDLALLHILDEVAAKWPGIATNKFYMMGFSGGGQFVHRFAYLHPERLHAISVGAPGRATFLDPNLRWPDGIKDITEQFGQNTVLDKSQIRAMKGIHLVVGDVDNAIHGGSGFWEWLAMKKKELQPTVGSKDTKGVVASEKLSIPRKGRIDTLKELQESWKREGIMSKLDIVPGVAHDSGGVHLHVEEFFRILIRGHPL
ncbi:hypothetical protein V499_04088 [Pseudogymnoascus sp. VKM F-103]|nr:hypothetical protein V499_04088 [Pseudogymnoascus sp. VKM F-103]